MSESQPRNEDGQFIEFDSDNPKMRNDENTLGVYDESQITPRVEFTNVDIELLEKAIEKAKTFEGVVRIGTINKIEERSDGKTEEWGIVFLKGSPSESEVVAACGLMREFDDE